MNPNRIGDTAKNLLKMAKNLPGGVPQPAALGVIFATGEHAYRREDGVLVLPICALRD